MPRFYFDTDTARFSFTDEEGVIIPLGASFVTYARQALGDLAVEEWETATGSGPISITVRAADRVVTRLALTLTVSHPARR